MLPEIKVDKLWKRDKKTCDKKLTVINKTVSKKARDKKQKAKSTL